MVEGVHNKGVEPSPSSIEPSKGQGGLGAKARHCLWRVELRCQPWPPIARVASAAAAAASQAKGAQQGLLLGGRRRGVPQRQPSHAVPLCEQQQRSAPIKARPQPPGGIQATGCQAAAGITAAGC